MSLRKFFVPLVRALPSRSDLSAARLHHTQQTGIRQFLHDLSLSYKIGLGSAVAIGLSAMGLALGNLYGQHQENIADHAIKTNHDDGQHCWVLHNSLLNVRLQQQELLSRFEDAQERHRAYQEVSDTLQDLEELFNHIQVSPLTQADSSGGSLLRHIELPVRQYIQDTRHLLQRLHLDSLEPKAMVAAKQEMALFLQRPQIRQLDAISKQLGEEVDRLAKSEDKNREIMEVAQTLHGQIVWGSLGASLVVAIAVASYLSWLITRPLKEVTQVAKWVTEADNFEIQVAVTGQDEVGEVAEALNELINRVKTLLEQQKLEAARQMQDEKLASLGRMVAGVAHEINNPVNFIHGNIHYAETYIDGLLRVVDLYQRHYPQPHPEIARAIAETELEFLQEDAPKILDSMRIGSDRIKQIVRALRTFSRIDEATVKPIDLHEGLDSTLLILHHRLKAKMDRPEIPVVKTYGQLPEVECYAGQLNQVFMNILANAIDALESAYEQGQITTPEIQVQTELLVNRPQWIRITISDNGIGIPPQHLTQLFDPFFTTKPVGQGTGLGLAISYQIIVDRHKGQLTCQSELGRGTQFVIEIPLQLATDGMSPASPEHQIPSGIHGSPK